MRVEVKNSFIQKRIKIPPLGERIQKTGIAVFICLFIYYLRGYQGMVTQSCVAAIICIQPFKKDGIREAINRVEGMLLGGLWGLLFLLLLKVYPILGAAMPVAYFLMAVGIVLAIYSTVLMKHPDVAGLTAIVYICLVAGYPNLEEPVMATVNQMIDTFIGVAVAAAVSTFEMQRIKHPEYIFFVRLQDLVPDRYAHVSSRVLVMLNRLYNDGARISLVSRWAPAFLLSQMGTMNINLPVIVMDGAALYDIAEKQYQKVTEIPKETAAELEKILLERDLGYAIYTVRESNMFVYRRGKDNSREEEDYQMMKRSPYRNYVNGEIAPEDHIVFIRLVGDDDKIHELEKELYDAIPKDVLRMDLRKQPRVKGCSGLYFYHKDATIQNRKKDLLADLQANGEHGLVPVDMISERSYVSEVEAVNLLNQLRDVYEPVSKWNGLLGM